MKDYKINKVAVLGSGIMGSRIAAQLANVGLNVLLLDIIPNEISEKEKKLGLTLNDKRIRNKIVNDSLRQCLKLKPKSFYDNKFSNRIETGNFIDDFSKIKEADWIIEVVVERIDIKVKIFNEVEKYRKPNSIVSSNTSGIPIIKMIENRNENFKLHFLGTHFFNPPRYLELLEIIPTNFTGQHVTNFMMKFGKDVIGKDTILCKDSPAFIANRIGVASILVLFKLISKYNFSIKFIDILTGNLIGRPKSATFRTCDVVGIDVLNHVAKGLFENCKNDEFNDFFNPPNFIKKIINNHWLGDKTRQGFYKKINDSEGKSEILYLDLKTFEYRKQEKINHSIISNAKQINDLNSRIIYLFNCSDEIGLFYKDIFSSLFSYVSNRVPEISDNFVSIDNAMKSGFGWELGPFEIWDILGVKVGYDSAIKNGYQPANWVKKLIDSGNKSFYIYENGKNKYYDLKTDNFLLAPNQSKSYNLSYLKNNNLIWKNNDASIIDIGDEIINLEFNSKMNSIGSGSLDAINYGIDLAEKNYKGLVIANQAINFSVGANLAMIFMLAVEQEFEELNLAIKLFQNTTQNIRYSNIPVVSATQGMALGGGCEIALHSDITQAFVESYIGLVEMGVGLIPGGGGSKEMAMRASNDFNSGGIMNPVIKNYFLNIGMAKVSTSAHDAFNLGLLRKNVDSITFNKKELIYDAKMSALSLYSRGYKAPLKEKNIKVLGKEILGSFLVGADSMYHSNYITKHEKLISEKLAYVIAGGDLSYPTLVSEQYLLDIEREAFLSLCGEKKTLERIEYMLKKGKPLRN
ncbi:MAG: 3-hydroxyacyl-CoA dehydrogenase/enoyl-CoA hydratase family protein [Flavobacteriales bacterium TMED288]|nr:3-hydroxyacyl-CoA dehydrogenase [Flavobacteriales bacterium]RPG53455.1 MAG: 3-hydroxyacyl-CoA dehydrogenase/enoyl-CoA hydratase family protein [Flavobacteriales bacterium TMED288]